MSAVPGTPVSVSNTPAATTYTSLTVPLATTTVGELNVVEISGFGNGTTINPTMATPAGWDKAGEKLDDAGTPCPWVGIYSRKYQQADADASVTSVTLTWTTAGQMNAVCTPFSGQDPTAPISYVVFVQKLTSDVNYVVSGTTGADAGVLNYGFADKTSNAWSGATDTVRAQPFVSSISAAMIALSTAADVPAGTAFSKSVTGPNTAAGVGWAFVVKGAPAPTGPTVAVWDGSNELAATVAVGAEEAAASVEIN